MSYNLHLLQEKIFSALTGEENAVSEILCPQSPLSAEQRIGIYRSSMQGALINTLRDTFTVTCQLVGDNFFNAMAQLYVQQTPSQSPNIQDYGATLAQFIATFSPAAELPYLSDVANLEWAWHSALHGENNPPTNLAQLVQVSEVDYAQVVFHLPKNATLLNSAYPVHKIWHLHQADYLGNESVDLNQGEVKLLVWRQEMDMRMDVLNEKEWMLLNALQEKKAVGEICDLYPELNITEILGMLAASGKITTFSLATECPFTPTAECREIEA